LAAAGVTFVTKAKRSSERLANAQADAAIDHPAQAEKQRNKIKDIQIEKDGGGSALSKSRR
jgi:hypothetical protein